MSSNLLKKTHRLICCLLAFIIAAGFIPVPTSADSKYDKYIEDLENYNARVAAYEQYQRELAYYNEHNAEWEAYDAQLAAYNAYVDYLDALAAYNEAVATYPERLEAYNAYTQYLENAAKSADCLEVIDAVISGGMYDTLMGDTVDEVLANKDKIGGYTTVSESVVESAASATQSLRSILSGYNRINTVLGKFDYYKANYSSLCSNFLTLFSNLKTLYSDNAVKLKLTQEGKTYRYCEFLCELYTIARCLNDSITVDTGWKISSDSGMLTYSQLGGYCGLVDTNTASPNNVNLPPEVPYAEYPETPVMPVQVEKVLEPIAPSGSRPYLPTPVADPGNPPTLPTYTITWKNYDGSVIKTDQVEYGVTPNYNGATPTKPATDQYTYTFKGWTPSVKTTDSDATYTADFDSVENDYTVTWKNYDGTVLKTDTVKYGETPSYTGSNPKKQSTAQYTYDFDGWSPAVSTVTGNATYTATFKSSENSYTVTWKNYDGKVLKTDTLTYGATPSYSGTTPTKPATDQYTYTFSGWTPSITTVTGDITYIAVFGASEKSYTVTWKNYDGKVLKTDTLTYGDMPSYSGTTPTKPSTAQYSYTFDGWSPAVSTVTGNATYTATFKSSENSYTVTWKNYDGKVLKTDTLTYGDMPSYSGATPTKSATDQYTYTFDGWNPTVSKVTGNATYIATFKSSENSYTVTWKNHDGTVLKTDTLAYGATPSYSGTTPKKTATAQYTYTFDGWTPAVSTVTGSATYTATFKSSENSYTVTWKNYDGTVLKTDTLTYGDMPSYSGSTPTKPATAQYTYTFSGWTTSISSVTGNATYTAKFSETVNTYTVTWKNYDGSVLKTDTLTYGATPSYSGTTPTKTATAQYTYTFSTWTPSISSVTGNVTYTAKFSETVNTYTVTWKNYDGKTLKTDTLAYGATPSYGGSTPTKTATAQYTYTFSGWTPSISSVTENATYTAEFSETVNKYTVTWKNYDGNVLKSDTVAYGTVPAYTGTTPKKPATSQQTFMFDSWTPTISEVKGNVTYTAVFTSSTNKYTITWNNYDGTLLKKDADIDYGTTISYSGATPTKPATAQYSYTFDGWTPAVAKVTGNATYTATFKSSENTYTVTWKNYDGTVLKTDTVTYGATPSYSGTTPTKPSTAQYSYTFSGWSSALSAVTQNVTYTATFSSSGNSYTVTWKNYDGTVLKTESLDYGAKPVYGNADPTKPSTDQYTYTFSGWTPTISNVTDNATYTAKFSETLNQYTVTWNNYDGTLLKSEKLNYGAVPSYSGTKPTRAETAQYTYTFDGWSPTVAKVTGDATYTATFKSNETSYKITWKNEDGSVLKTETVVYGTVPSYGAENPTKAATAQYTYVFSGWTPAITAVTGDVSYVAAYSSAVNKYTVIWNDQDGKLLKKDEGVEYGSMPLYSGTTPTMAPTAQYTYTFDGWSPDVVAVTGNVTYVAKFKSSENSYDVTWKNYDGTVLKTEKVVYGETPSYSGSAPVKASTLQSTYTFDGWTPAVTAVTGDVVYEAKFTETVNKYTVTWNNFDGTLLKKDTDVAYDTMPSYVGEIPTKPSTDQYIYTFTGWTPALAAVNGDVTYTAVFEMSLNKYTVKWNNYDGTLLKEDADIEYGLMPSYTGDAPIKPSNAQYTYTFDGWTPEISTVSGDVTYTAKFTETLNKYTVTWENYDGTILKTDKLDYGIKPSYEGQSPKKPNTDQYKYEFDGWDPIVNIVTDNITYKAHFSETVNVYTVIWKDGDTVLQSDTLEYGTMPVYNGNTDKEATKEKTFEFLGWSPEVSEVSGNAVYIAMYKETTIYYGVVWQIGDTSLPEQLYEYMQIPKEPKNPEQYLNSDEKTFAKFVSWNKEVGPVTDNTIYTAVFKADIFDLPKDEKENVLLMPSKNIYTVIPEKYNISIGLSKLAELAVSHERDLMIEYENGVQIYFQSSLASEIIEKKLHISLVLGNTIQEVQLLSSHYLENSTSEEDTVFGGRVVLTDDDENIVQLSGWQLRVPIENGNMSGLSGYSLDNGERSYKLSQLGNYAVFVSDGSAEFKLIRKLSVRVEANEGGNVTFGEIKSGENVQANINAALGYEVESVEVYYDKDGEKVAIDFNFETNTFLMPEYNVVFNVKFQKLTFTVNFYVDDELYSTAVYNYGDDLVVPEDPVKADDADVSYNFLGWSPDVKLKVSESINYYAKFNASIVADDDYGNVDYGCNFPYRLFTIAVLFFGTVGGVIYLIVRFAKKRKKNASNDKN